MKPGNRRAADYADKNEDLNRHVRGDRRVRHHGLRNNVGPHLK